MFACSWKTAGMAYGVVFAIALALKSASGLPDLLQGGVLIYSEVFALIAPLV